MESTDGRLQRAGSRWQLEFTRHLPHPPEKVWRAITEPEHLAAWFPAEMRGARARGATLTFVFEQDEAPVSEGEILTYDPPSVFEFRWDKEELRFELRPEGDGTALRFLNTFDELGKAARDAAGWHACLDLLFFVVAGREPPEGSESRWSEVHPRYVDNLGPEAATIGPPDWAVPPSKT